MNESFAELFEQSIASQRIRPGTILNGLIVEVGQDYVIVNVGLKSEAVIPSDQFKNEKGAKEFLVADTVSVASDTAGGTVPVRPGFRARRQSAPELGRDWNPPSRSKRSSSASLPAGSKAALPS